LASARNNVVVVGTGYVGLTSGACLATLGHQVICIDNDQTKLKAIESGNLPIYEPGLDEIVSEQLSNGNLRLSSDLQTAVSDAEFVFLCLPTPPQSDGSADISILLSVVETLRSFIPAGVVVINKSTVPVTSSRQVQLLLGDDNPVVANPEFLREGSAVSDFLNPDRIVIGSENLLAAQLVADLYASLNAPIVFTDPASAETIKYMANSFLAAKISFVNEVARFSHHVGADAQEVLRGLSFDERIGSQYLSPGPGWGGSCFPKDTKALLASARLFGLEMPMVENAVHSNELHFEFIVETIRKEADTYASPVIAVLGLSFKAMTDDVRESPAVRIAENLKNLGYTLQAYDPMAKGPESLADTRVQSVDDALRGAHVTVILTEWAEFADIEPSKLSSLMIGRSVVDSRYIIDKRLFEAADFRVLTVG